ncbi:MAG: phage portal protein [Candidatus Nanoarchaeia archaeon]|nr:phage portal protein [Candidatus Nanoarchaeia archaeon]
MRGLSPNNALRLGVEQNLFASLYNKNFFKDGAAIGGMISVPESLTQEQFDRILGQFNERHQGYSRSHRIALIEGDAKFTSSNMSQRDMEFISLKDVTRREILAAFKTNEVVLGDYGQIQSFEGIKQAHKSFWEETLLPIMLMIENILWARLFSKLSETKGKIWASFDTSSVESLREDYELKTTMAKTLADIGFPLNEINKKLDLGFPELPWGNTWFVKVGMVPVESILNGDVDNSNNNEDKKPKEEPTVEDEEDDNKEEKKNIIDLSNRDDALWSRFIARQIPIENIAISKLKKIFYEQRKKILQNISYKKKDILDFFDDEEKELKKVLMLIYNMSSNIGLELLSEEVVSDSLIDSNEEITKLIENRLNNISVNIINTIKNNLLKIINNSYDNNSIQENLIEEIKKYYNKLSNRIKNMARTEVNSIINGARYIHMKNIGVTHSKWISKSEIGRESHKSINGKVVKLGDSFSDKFIIKYPTDSNAPLSEIIGCSCITIPIINIK